MKLFNFSELDKNSFQEDVFKMTSLFIIIRYNIEFAIYKQSILVALEPMDHGEPIMVACLFHIGHIYYIS